MILGFGNNIVSSLASDITAGQTTIPVIPGDGPLFASLLTSDFSNKSTMLKNYAKITLTDSGETAFEICHLTAVSGDNLTVVRGQEGTVAKGWALKDVIANFATRGSENGFVQVAEAQSGFYTSGTAGGSANALTLELPTTFFLNGSADWVLKTPIVVYPSQNNTGAATLQLTMGGRVLGTFPLYKGNKAQLTANDILKDVALVCLLDNTKTFFSVANPGAIYAGLGTAAFRDVQTSKDDVTAGRVLVNGGALALRTVKAKASGGEVTDVNNVPNNSVSFVYTDAAHSPGYSGSLLDFSGLSGLYNIQIAAEYGGSGGKRISFRTKNGDAQTWNNWFDFYHTGNKPTASDVGALPLSGGTLTGQLTIRNGAPIIQLAETDTGKNYFIVLDGSGFRIDEDSTAGNSILQYASGSKQMRTVGQFVPGSYANFDARYVSNIQFGAAASMSGSLIGGSAVINVPAGCVITGLTDSGKENGIIDNIDFATYKPIQKYINGSWVTISG